MNNFELFMFVVIFVLMLIYVLFCSHNFGFFWNSMIAVIIAGCVVGGKLYMTTMTGRRFGGMSNSPGMGMMMPPPPPPPMYNPYQPPPPMMRPY